MQRIINNLVYICRVKHLLIICNDAKILSPLACAYFNKYKKCEATLHFAGLQNATMPLMVSGFMETQELALNPNQLLIINNTAQPPIDYVLSLSQEAYDYSKLHFKQALLFNYNSTTFN
jgi:hypothetical protein